MDILHELEAAVRGGEKMAQVESGTRDQAAALAAQVRGRPGPRIAAVIDRGCFSSCMDFVQQISLMADTVVLGESSIPAPIYTAFRATREPFVPDLPYLGNMADEPALMKWVAATLTKLKPGQKH